MPQVGPVRPGRSLRGVSARVSIPQEEGLGGMIPTSMPKCRPPPLKGDCRRVRGDSVGEW